MKPSEIRKAKERIEHGSPTARAANRAAEAEGAARDIAFLGEKILGVSKSYREMKSAWTGVPCPEDEPPRAEPDNLSTSRLMQIGALAATSFEAVLGAYICAHQLAFSQPVGAGIGAMVATVFTIVSKAVLIRFHQPQFPTLGYERIKLTMRSASWTSVAALVVLLAARTVDWLTTAADVSLAVLSVSLPILAGSLLVGAFIVGWPNRFWASYRKLIAELHDTQRFLDWLNEEQSLAAAMVIAPFKPRRVVSDSQ